jgi:hypothetical protein
VHFIGLSVRCSGSTPTSPSGHDDELPLRAEGDHNRDLGGLDPVPPGSVLVLTRPDDTATKQFSQSTVVRSSATISSLACFE